MKASKSVIIKLRKNFWGAEIVYGGGASFMRMPTANKVQPPKLILFIPIKALINANNTSHLYLYSILRGQTPLGKKYHCDWFHYFF